MPPFNYGSGYVNPYVASISALLQQPGQIEAQRAMTVGNAQAQAAQASGQAYGNAIQGAGQAISGAIQQATDPRRQMELMAFRAAQEKARGNAVIDKAMQGYQPVGPQPEGEGPAAVQHPYLDENGLYDIPKLTQALSDSGLAHSAPELLKGAEQINDSILKHQELQQKTAQAATLMYGDMADGIVRMTKAGVPFAQALDLASAPGLATKRFDPQQYAQLKEKLLSLPPEQQQAALGTLMDSAAKLGGNKTLAKDAQEVDRYGRPVASNIVNEPGKGDYTINGQRFHADGTKVGEVQPTQTQPKDWQKSSVLLDGKPAEILTDPAPNGKIYDLNRKPIENAAARIKPIPSAAAVQMSSGSLSDVALDEAARVYNQTGKLPPGMGAVGIARQTAVMNRAAQLDPNAALAANAATFKADSQNLTRLQTTEGTLSSFERAAGKNLDTFMALADKVPDTGVPWANQPIRSVNARALGSADQAAFNAARDVALREIARVTNDPKLSGALTDTARKEVLGLIPADATFAQIKRVTQVLKQDMANVHSGVNDEIATVKDRLGANPNKPATPAVPANVAAALKGIAPGIHKLSDGSSWMVGADGSITKQ